MHRTIRNVTCKLPDTFTFSLHLAQEELALFNLVSAKGHSRSQARVSRINLNQAVSF